MPSDIGFGGCGCGYAPNWTIALPPLPPGPIEVRLVPAPGALPELPGFPGDDETEVTPCSADLDGDGTVGFGDLLVILAEWGPCGESCAADLDDSGDVGFGDLLAALSAWGPCLPV